MAYQYRFDVRSVALLGAYLGALASPLACQSDDQNDTAGDATTAGAGNTAGTAGLAANSGNPAAAAPTNTVSPNESPAVENLAPAAPANTPNPQATPAAAANAATAPTPTFAACTYSEGTYGRNCDFVYVSMKQASPARCVQLTFDNCGEYSSRGLSVDVPRPWVLDSGTVSSDPDECELGVYYPTSSVALRASGEVTWNETTRLPSELVLDVTLLTSTSATDASIELTTTTPLATSDCPD